MTADDRTHKLLTQIRADLRALLAVLVPQATAPNLQYPLAHFVCFDWQSIGASVLEKDRHGATLVSWAGRIYSRRSPANKFGEAIWFSRFTGKGESGSNNYERLITFKQLRYEVEPLPDKVARHLSAIAN